MPGRFTAFTDEQARQIAAEFNLRWHRTALLIACLAVGAALGFGVALYKIKDASDRGDRASAAAARVNRSLAVASKLQALQSAANAYAACRRQQEQIAIQREFYKLILPRHLAGRTAQQKAAVAGFYSDLQAHHILTIPVCVKPPKSS